MEYFVMRRIEYYWRHIIGVAGETDPTEMMLEVPGGAGKLRAGEIPQSVWGRRIGDEVDECGEEDQEVRRRAQRMSGFTSLVNGLMAD